MNFYEHWTGLREKLDVPELADHGWEATWKLTSVFHSFKKAEIRLELEPKKNHFEVALAINMLLNGLLDTWHDLGVRQPNPKRVNIDPITFGITIDFEWYYS